MCQGLVLRAIAATNISGCPALAEMLKAWTYSQHSH